MKLLLIVLFTFSTTLIYAEGIIRGTVHEEGTGEPLIGATIAIKGTTSGTITDLEGKFSIETSAGLKDLQISYISFQTLTIEGVEVKDNEVIVLDNISLKSSSYQLKEAVVTARVVRTSEAALMTVKKQSPVILDGISSAKMQLTGDATAVEAAKRVTGVSIEDGKYVYVRGLGDRYSKTTLNHVDIPGLDPDMNTIQMDIFPTNLIDNMMVSKNFTADMPADFTGGMMNIETKAFPEEKFFTISLGTAYNPDMHLNSDYLGYKGGSTDFLGFDDGTRALPEIADQKNIPTPISGHSKDEVNNFVKSFNPELSATPQTSLMDISASISFGNQISLGKDKENRKRDSKLGYIFSLSYNSGYQYYDDVTYGEYQRNIDINQTELRYATLQNGTLSERNILAGALGGLAYKTQYSKFRLTAMRLQNGQKTAGKFRIDNNGEAVGQSGYFAESDNLEYNERSLTNLLLNGTHVLKKSGWEIDWRLSPTYSTSDDPDIRKTAFTFSPNDTSFNAGAGGNPARIWRSLNEVNATAKVDVIKTYKFTGNDAKLKFGASHTYKQRDYEILFFDIQFFGSQSWSNPNPSIVLNPDNLYPNQPNSIYYQSGNNSPNPNAYESNVQNSGLYISNEFNLHPKFKSILGLRAENFVQRHTGRDQAFASGDMQNGRNLNNDKVLESMDLFPSANFIYSLTENQNLRATYSRTIARPSFKELSFAQILDPITNRIFNGSLFTYGDWDGNLVETHIENLDLRWELFLKGGQIFSISAFAKQFDNPIELVRIPEQQTSTEYQPRNVGDGLLYGIELEIRKKLDFIAQSLSNFRIDGNVTFVKSQIEMSATEFNSRKTYLKTGEEIEETRQMAGQSPYVVNAGFGYSHSELGLDAGLFYNAKGSTLYIVGAGLFPDIYLEPFHGLDFSINKKLGEEKNTVVDFKVSNILNDRRETVYRSFEASDQIFSSLNPGRTFSIGISHKF
ncbi:MAG: TonB-dependent receptor [Bacteroidia bacterium]